MQKAYPSLHRMGEVSRECVTEGVDNGYCVGMDVLETGVYMGKDIPTKA